MTVIRQVVDHVSDATLKGRLLSEVGSGNQGFNDTAIFDMTGAMIDGETFSLGSNVFEFNDVSTAETATGTAAAADTNAVTLNVAPDRDFVAGEVFIIDAEFCKVTSHVAGSLSVFCERGYAGSTAAIQAADVIQRVAAARVPVTGNIIVPLVDLTQADADAKIVAAVPALRSEYGATLYGTNDVIFDVAYSDAHPANDGTDVTNGTLANFAGGYDSLSVNKSVALVGTLTSTTFDLYAPGTILAVGVRLFDDSGTVVAHDTTADFTGNKVTVTEGATVWENDVDYCLVEVYYAN